MIQEWLANYWRNRLGPAYPSDMIPVPVAVMPEGMKEAQNGRTGGVGAGRVAWETHQLTFVAAPNQYGRVYPSGYYDTLILSWSSGGILLSRWYFDPAGIEGVSAEPFAGVDQYFAQYRGDVEAAVIPVPVTNAGIGVDVNNIAGTMAITFATTR